MPYEKLWTKTVDASTTGTYNQDGTPNAMNAAWAGQWDAKEISVNKVY